MGQRAQGGGREQQRGRGPQRRQRTVEVAEGRERWQRATEGTEGRRGDRGPQRGQRVVEGAQSCRGDTGPQMRHRAVEETESRRGDRELSRRQRTAEDTSNRDAKQTKSFAKRPQFCMHCCFARQKSTVPSKTLVWQRDVNCCSFSLQLLFREMFRIFDVSQDGFEASEKFPKRAARFAVQLLCKTAIHRLVKNPMGALHIEETFHF